MGGLDVDAGQRLPGSYWRGVESRLEDGEEIEKEKKDRKRKSKRAERICSCSSSSLLSLQATGIIRTS